MILADVSIRRPVFAVTMTLALVVLGTVSYTALSVDLFPEIDFPYVVVTVVYPGAGAEAVELDVTKKIEDAVNPIAGVKSIQSTAQEGYSLTVIEFTLETDPLDAAAEVRDRVTAARALLPDDIEPPVIQRFDPSAQPIIALAVSGPQPSRDLTDYADEVIKRRLDNIPGVGSAELVGAAEREIQIRLDPVRLAALDLSPQQVADQIGLANLELPAGRLVEGRRELVVRTMGRVEQVTDFEDVVVLTPHGRLLRLEEIATVSDTEAEPRSASRLNGLPAVGINITRQSGANTVEVAERVHAELDRLRLLLPPGMSITVARDYSTFIRDAVHDVLINIAYGGTLAVLVIFLFLSNLRSTLISALAIPTSIIATFTLMRAMGFTLNTMTLLGLSLAVGLLIDDAIVVIENIYRHLEMGKKPEAAAKDATSEIGLAVSATTFSIVVVFLPVAFMSGIVGQFFFSFGITVACAVVVSLFVAFTLTPMLSARFLTRDAPATRAPLYRVLALWDDAFRYVERAWYRPALRWCLSHRFVTLSIATLAFAVSLALVPLIGSEFLPATDENVFFVSFEGLPGESLETTIRQIEPVERLLKGMPEVASVLTTIGAGTRPVYGGTISAQLVDKSERERSVFAIMKAARQELTAIPGYLFTVDREEAEGGGRPIDISLCGPDLERLEHYADVAIAAAGRVPGVADLKSSLEKGKPELQVSLRRDLAADLGVTPAAVAQNLRLFVDGLVVTRFKDEGEEYDVRVQVQESDRRDPKRLGRLPVPSTKEITGRDRFTVPLAQIAAISRTSGPSQVNRYDRQREIRVTGSVVDRPAGDVRADVMLVLDSLDLLPGYSLRAVGEAEIQAESFSNIFTALILAVIFIYLILASQYDSFSDPLSIMGALPLAIIGALVSLWIFGSALSIMSLIGLVLLMGLVTKNGILLIDFAKQRRRLGMERDLALLEAGPIRLRPILMTTFSTIAGALPLALGLGEGAEFRAPIARAVIGGMVSSTVLTLLVVPVIYSYIDDLTHGNFRALFGLERRKGSAPRAD